MKWIITWAAVIGAGIVMVLVLRSIARTGTVEITATSSRKPSPSDNTSGILHAGDNPGAPAAPRSCPPGYHRVKGMFIEKDGTKQDAWVADDITPGASSIDYLMPGESVNIPLPLFVMPPEQRPAKTGEAM
jgi:hypothetical protein